MQKSIIRRFASLLPATPSVSLLALIVVGLFTCVPSSPALAQIRAGDLKTSDLTKPNSGPKAGDLGKPDRSTGGVIGPLIGPALDRRSRLVFPDGPLNRATTVDEFIAGLTDWKEASRKRPDRQTESNGGSRPPVSKDGRDYNVTVKKYSITETPEEIVTYQPVTEFWLGAIVQQQGLKLGAGSMQEVAIPSSKRAPLSITTNIAGGNNSRSVSAPSLTAFNNAMSSLQTDRNVSGGARTVSIVDNLSEEQTAQELGLSARYMSAKVAASFKSNRFNRNHTITANFIERAFTATADFEGRTRRAAFFNDSFTVADAKELVKQGQISNGGLLSKGTNLPTYVKSITYGRVVIFNLTSTLSESEMKAAISGSVNGLTWGVNANAAFSEKVKNTTFQLRVTEFGGSDNGFSRLIPAQGMENVLSVMKSYLEKTARLSDMVPISYSVNTLRDDQLAALSVTTDYSVPIYTPDPIGERFKITMWAEVLKSNDGADSSIEIHGNLRINGNLWWEIYRDKAKTREAGHTLKISEDTENMTPKSPDFVFDTFYNPQTPFHLQLTLLDKDKLGKDDRVATFDQRLDLKAMGEGTTNYLSRTEHGTIRLNIKLERLDYL